MDKDLINHKPLVSIIMLTYNRALYIGAAVSSIFDQNFEDWELLIIDDGSTDKTEAVITPFLKDPRIRYIKRPERFGIAKNRNFGLREARGDYIAVLDSDDVWIDKDKLQKQIDFLKEHSDHVLVGTNFERIDENGRLISKVHSALDDRSIRQNILLRNEFAHSSVVFLKSRAVEVGYYDETLFIWEDYDLWLKLGKTAKFANLPDNTTAYRLHSANIMRNKRIKGALIMMQIIKRYQKSYPNFLLAYVKALLRILVRAVGL